MRKIILFTGHRDAVCADESLALIELEYPGALWIHGNAKGFDTCVEQYANAHGIKTIKFEPQYQLYGKRAPIVRDEQMVKIADICVALWDGRKTGGTYFTVTKAMEKGIDIIRVARKD